MRAGQGKRRGLLALCLLGMMLFGALGCWQVQRLAWKRDLIGRVEARIAAPAAPIPARPEWPRLDERDQEYRRVRVSGVFLHDRQTLVDALTERGAGAWVMTPLQTADGVVLINRGFVSREEQARSMEAAAPDTVTLTGLLRASEPEGRILRPNDPASDRWFSRDVAAIAAARGIAEVAPFFIDADATADPAAPVGGLTVVRFRNAHLTYALTWFALAALCGSGLLLLRRLPPGEDQALAGR